MMMDGAEHWIRSFKNEGYEGMRIHGHTMGFWRQGRETWFIPEV